MSEVETNAENTFFDVVVKQLSSQLCHGGHLLASSPRTIKAILGDNEWGTPMWPQRVDRDTGEVISFSRFEDFVTTPPTAGLGATVDMLMDICRRDPQAVDMIDRAVQRPHGGDRSKTLNQQLASEADTRQDGSSRHLRRLRKDRPDLHEKVLAGEMTISEAAVKAGFYPERVSIRLDSAASAVATICKKAPPEYIIEMIGLMLGQVANGNIGEREPSQGSYRSGNSTVVQRIPILDDTPEDRRVTMTQRLPSISKYLASDVFSWADDMIIVRDNEFWREVGAESWEDYCTRIVGKPLDWCTWVIGWKEVERIQKDARFKASMKAHQEARLEALLKEQG